MFDVVSPGSDPWDTGHANVAPAVFGAEYAGYGSDEAVEAVYLPSERVQAEDREAQIELRHDSEGNLTMLAYSSLETLVDCCGEAQSWVSVRVDRLSQVEADVGAQVVLWDIELPDDMRHATN